VRCKLGGIAVFERQRGLDQSGHTPAAVQVSDIRLQGPDGASPVSQSGLVSAASHRIAERGRISMAST
jgi:hypothetical protein